VSPIQVHVLGGGTPRPAGHRFGSSWLVDLGEQRILFDCGPAATQKLARHGFSPTQIDDLFFTHHHFDHDADYPAFALSRWDQGAELIPDLRVHGPWPTAEVTEALFGDRGAFRFDIQARVNNRSSQRAHQLRGGDLPRHPPAFEIDELEAGHVVEGAGWRVATARVEHAQPYVESLAYRLEADGRSIVVTGDCAPTGDLADFATGADLLLIMCWDLQASMDAAGFAGGMTATSTAGRVAARAGVRKLGLVHLNPDLDTDAGRHAIGADVASEYGGEVIITTEDTVIEL
jgi:ribonuclease BN (tRNA processing enzyme)